MFPFPLKDLVIRSCIPLFLLLAGCKKDNQNVSEGKEGTWRIPKEHVKDGGPGKDGIPSIDDPKFVDKANVGDYLDDQDLVLGFRAGNEIRAYPHPILDRHEIVNDAFNGVKIAITYCPLTGTGIGWDRVVNGATTTFGVSGLLYNNNLIPYDRNTNSNWSQMRNDCVNGTLIDQKIEIHQLVETTWATWKEMYPDTRVLSTNTGYDRDYTTYPYGDYKNNGDLLFPVTNLDNRLPRKERVLGVVVDGSAKAYRFDDFSENEDVTLIQDNFKGKELVIAGSKPHNFLIAFERSLNDSTHSFSAVQNELPVIMKDSSGTKWDVFGKATSGPMKGEHLRSPESYIGYWFAWGAFYPDTEIH